MKILFACHRLPYPPKRGGKIRPFNIIKHFHEQGHEVTVGSLARSNEELEEGQGLRDYCEKLLVGSIGKVSATAQMVARLPTFSPSTMGYFYSAALHKLMRAEIEGENYDLVFVHCSSAAQYVSAHKGIPSIMDFGDMDSHKWLDYSTFRHFPLSMGYWFEGTKLCREEKRLARRFDLSTCTTEAELATLRGLSSARQTDWFPNGVDADYFVPTEKPYDPDQICFIGRMDYYPNQQAMLYFCNDVLPLIQTHRPATKLTIVGAEPTVKIRNLAEIRGVTVTGTVPDVRDYVRGSALSVAPLAIGRGTQNKILESMAMGVPVICSKSAAGGVDALPGQHLLVAESPDQYADSIIRLLENADERRKLSIAARQRVLSSHSWPASMTKLDTIIGAVAGSPS